MAQSETVYVIGTGAIGFPLAAHLAAMGRRVVAVRTRHADATPSSAQITVHRGAASFTAAVETAALASVRSLDGIIVVATKAYSNPMLARELAHKAATGPLVLLQNGLGVEAPFRDAQFSAIYRCVLYVTSQAQAAQSFSFRPVTTSPIGTVVGSDRELLRIVAALTSNGFPFRAEANIEREVWQKAIINAVFNSICPLLDVDNGIFARDQATARLAQAVIDECIAVTDRLGLGLRAADLLERLLRISQGSDGQLISTLQDIRAQRPTEIEFLNLAIARIAATLDPPVDVPRTALLGQLIVARSQTQRPGATVESP